MSYENSLGKKAYLDNLSIGQLVAFKISDEKIASAKVIEIKDNDLIVESKYGKKNNITKEDIVWVKTGRRWPKSIYEKFKGGK